MKRPYLLALGIAAGAADVYVVSWLAFVMPSLNWWQAGTCFIVCVGLLIMGVVCILEWSEANASKDAKGCPAQPADELMEAVEEAFEKGCLFPQRLFSCEQCEMFSQGCIWPKYKAARKRLAKQQ